MNVSLYVNNLKRTPTTDLDQWLASVQSQFIGGVDRAFTLEDRKTPTDKYADTRAFIIASADFNQYNQNHIDTIINCISDARKIMNSAHGFTLIYEEIE